MSSLGHPIEVTFMGKEDINMRLRAVLKYLENSSTQEEVSSVFGISSRTLRRWLGGYNELGLECLKPKSRRPKKSLKETPSRLVNRIIALKQRCPAWGPRRIKHQNSLPVHWMTVHRVIKKRGLLIRLKPKPQPCKRFQRRHVDSLWQGDIFEFRIRGAGKIYVFGFLDDCSRYRVRSKAYTRKRAREAVRCLRWALRRGRKPEALYLDNGRQFRAKEFKAECRKLGIKLIFGKPRNARGRGKLESYHKTLYRELVSQKEFASLSHFRRELWKFDRKYNEWRKLSCLGWATPASVYSDKKYFNKHAHKVKKRTYVLATN